MAAKKLKIIPLTQEMKFAQVGDWVVFDEKIFPAKYVTSIWKGKFVLQIDGINDFDFVFNEDQFLWRGSMVPGQCSNSKEGFRFAEITEIPESRRWNNLKKNHSQQMIEEIK